MSRNRSHLTQQLETFRAGFVQRLPKAEREIIEAYISGQGDGPPGVRSPKPGDKAPVFALPDQHGRIVRLEERLALGPVVLLFVRGGWSPFCSLTLRAYQEWLTAIHDEGAEVLAVTPQPATDCSQIAERDLLAFPTLSDQGNQVAARYDVVQELEPLLRPMHLRLGHDVPKINGLGDWSLPRPASFVIGSDGVVAVAHVPRLKWQRLEPSDALAAIRALPARREVDAFSSALHI